MGFMIPVAERFAAYHVETTSGTEIVPEDVCGALDNEACLTPYESVANYDALEPYLEGSRIEGVERHEGWYGRLSAPGYLDATEWHGPYETEDVALDAVKEQYDVDDNGDDTSDGDDTRDECPLCRAAPHEPCQECPGPSSNRSPA